MEAGSVKVSEALDPLICQMLPFCLCFNRPTVVARVLQHANCVGWQVLRCLCQAELPCPLFGCLEPRASGAIIPQRCWLARVT